MNILIIMLTVFGNAYADPIKKDIDAYNKRIEHHAIYSRAEISENGNFQMNVASARKAYDLKTFTYWPFLSDVGLPIKICDSSEDYICYRTLDEEFFILKKQLKPKDTWCSPNWKYMVSDVSDPRIKDYSLFETDKPIITIRAKNNAEGIQKSFIFNEDIGLISYGIYSKQDDMKVFNLKSKYGLLAEKYLDSYQGINFSDKEIEHIYSGCEW